MPIPGTALFIEGHAIVSEDGMIADALGGMPERLRNEADWRYFQERLDAASLVVLGRLGHARHPNRGRRRLVLTHQIDGFGPDSGDPHASLWNPAGLPIEDALQRLSVSGGMLAITGGTGSFDLFLPFYDTFVLAEVSGFFIPGGTPCFSAGLPAPVLSRAGLIPGQTHVIDREANVIQTIWRRRTASG